MNATRIFRLPFVFLRGQFSSRGNDWLICLLISAAATLVCFLAAGPSLDLFLGTLLLSAMIAPSFGRIAPVVVGCSLVWFIAVLDGPVSIAQWIGCSLVLAAFIAAMVCMGRLLMRCGIHVVAASAIVTFTSLAWLTWPIWMGASGPIAIHPVFAINAACRELGIWTEQRIAYGLTHLGQDTAYRLPGSVFPAVFFHAALAGIFVVFSWIARISSNRRGAAPLDLNAHRLAIDEPNRR
jgi:hypothetical protein